MGSRATTERGRRKPGAARAAVLESVPGGCDPLLTIAEVGAWLGLSKSTVRRMVKRGQLPAGMRIGGQQHRWRKSTIERYIAECAARAGGRS